MRVVTLGSTTLVHLDELSACTSDTLQASDAHIEELPATKKKNSLLEKLGSIMPGRSETGEQNENADLRATRRRGDSSGSGRLTTKRSAKHEKAESQGASWQNDVASAKVSILFPPNDDDDRLTSPTDPAFAEA